MGGRPGQNMFIPSSGVSSQRTNASLKITLRLSLQISNCVCLWAIWCDASHHVLGNRKPLHKNLLTRLPQSTSLVGTAGPAKHAAPKLKMVIRFKCLWPKGGV